jgi:hypothetical protein
LHQTQMFQVKSGLELAKGAGKAAWRIIADNVMGGAKDFVGVVVNAIPRTAITVRAKVWGNTYATRKDLMKLGFAAILGRTSAAGFLPASQIVFTQDLMGEFVEVQGTFVNTSFLAGWNMFQIMNANMDDNNFTETIEFQPDKVKDLADVVAKANAVTLINAIQRAFGGGVGNIVIAGPNEKNNPLPPNAGGNMGTYAAVLVAALLLPRATTPLMKDRLADFQYRGTPA